MKRPIIALVIAFLVSFSVHAIAGPTVLDQSFDAGVQSGSTIEPVQTVGQSFTVGAEGLLARVGVQLRAGDVNQTGSVLLSLYESENDVPTALLGSVPIPAASIPFAFPGIFDYVMVDVAPLEINVTMGQQLAIVLSNSSSDHYYWFENLDGYGGGRASVYSSLFNSWGVMSPSVDEGFQTYVTLVPEPGSVLLLVVGLATATCLNRR